MCHHVNIGTPREFSLNVDFSATMPQSKSSQQEQAAGSNAASESHHQAPENNQVEQTTGDAQASGISNNEPNENTGRKAETKTAVKEVNGPKGLEPTRYGDWESRGRCHDF